MNARLDSNMVIHAILLSGVVLTAHRYDCDAVWDDEQCMFVIKGKPIPVKWALMDLEELFPCD